MGCWQSVSAGGFHTCGVTTSGSVECWGVGHQWPVRRARAVTPIATTILADRNANTSKFKDEMLEKGHGGVKAMEVARSALRRRLMEAGVLG
jgi:hypothetical protein